MAKVLTIVVCAVTVAVAVSSLLAAAAYALPSTDSKSLLRNAPSLVVPPGYRPTTFVSLGPSASQDGTIRVAPGHAEQLSPDTAPSGSAAAGPENTSASPGQQSGPHPSPTPVVAPSTTPTPTTDADTSGDDTGEKGTDSGDGTSKAGG